MCFLKGKIVSEVKFEFLYKANNISICIVDIELINKSVITVRAYDENADSEYIEGDILWLSGYVKNTFIVLESMNKEI